VKALRPARNGGEAPRACSWNLRNKPRVGCWTPGCVGVIDFLDPGEIVSDRATPFPKTASAGMRKRRPFLKLVWPLVVLINGGSCLGRLKCLSGAPLPGPSSRDFPLGDCQLGKGSVADGDPAARATAQCGGHGARFNYNPSGRRFSAGHQPECRFRRPSEGPSEAWGEREFDLQPRLLAQSGVVPFRGLPPRQRSTRDCQAGFPEKPGGGLTEIRRRKAERKPTSTAGRRGALAGDGGAEERSATETLRRWLPVSGGGQAVGSLLAGWAGGLGAVWRGALLLVGHGSGHARGVGSRPSSSPRPALAAGRSWPAFT